MPFWRRPRPASCPSRSTSARCRGASVGAKGRATAVYARWGLSLSDAINVFLVKSVEVGRLPFEMRPSGPMHDELSRIAYYAPVDDAGVVVAEVRQRSDKVRQGPTEVRQGPTRSDRDGASYATV
ncbi:type II toxin-antitoxin system RelB/DinJ family antitoxin [Thermophilibacter sp.]